MRFAVCCLVVCLSGIGLGAFQGGPPTDPKALKQYEKLQKEEEKREQKRQQEAAKEQKRLAEQATKLLPACFTNHARNR